MAFTRTTRRIDKDLDDLFFLFTLDFLFFSSFFRQTEKDDQVDDEEEEKGSP